MIRRSALVRRTLVAGLVAGLVVAGGGAAVDGATAVEAAASTTPGATRADRYGPPTNGEVLDPFRPPPEPWLPGNRGIEYATEPGSALVAIGPGRVAFAGQVAGRLVISIVHPDGLRSSLTGVDLILVRAGEVVEGGQVVAGAGATVHLGVRRGEAYLDPASLWGTAPGEGTVFLVPLDGGPSPPSAQASSLVTRVAVGVARADRLLAW